MEINDLLQKVVDAVERGGSGAEYLGAAFISFYRGGKNKIDLRESRVLDNSNLKLLFEILSIRRRPDWDDDELFQTEQKIKRLLGASN